MKPKEVKYIGGREIVHGTPSQPVFIECIETDRSSIAFFKTCKGAAEWLLSAHTEYCTIPLNQHSVMYDANRYEGKDTNIWDLALSSLSYGINEDQIIIELEEIYG